MLFDTTEVAQLVGFTTQITTQVWTHLMKIETQINLNLATKEKQNRIESRDSLCLATGLYGGYEGHGYP